MSVEGTGARIGAEETGAPTDVTGGMPATEVPAGETTMADPLAALDSDARAMLRTIGETLIPGAHGMPSAADVLNDDRLRFVLRARPDLAEPLRESLRPGLGTNAADRLARLADEPTNLSALQLVIVGGYYTDKGVRELIGYPGQMAIEVKSWLYPAYLEEGHIDAVLSRGPVWRDPATGRRAVATEPPRTYAERFSAEAGPGDGVAPEGGQ
jgi:hypothetical protein